MAFAEGLQRSAQARELRRASYPAPLPPVAQVAVADEFVHVLDRLASRPATKNQGCCGLLDRDAGTQCVPGKNPPMSTC